MTMIERVARALARRFNIYHFDRDSDIGWEECERDARAAIEAMREPDDVVLEAVLKAVKDELYSEGIGHFDVERGAEVRIFTAMIDAALEETK